MWFDGGRAEEPTLGRYAAGVTCEGPGVLPDFLLHWTLLFDYNGDERDGGGQEDG